MKKYFIRDTNQKSRPHYPFWMPWGPLGCFGRVIGFFLSLIAFLLLLWTIGCLLPHCQRDSSAAGSENDNGNPETVIPPDDIIQIPDSLPDAPLPGLPQPVDTVPVGNPGGGDNGGGSGGRHVAEPIPEPTHPITDPDNPVRRIDARQLLVIIKPGTENREEILRKFINEFKSLYPGNDYNVVYSCPETMIAVLEVPAEQRKNIRDNLPSQIPDINFFIDDVEVMGSLDVAPNDPLFANKTLSWHFDPVLAPAAWDVSTGSPEIKVAVVDSYFDLSNPDFAGLKIESPISLENGTTNVAPPVGLGDTGETLHGTHVLGIIAAQMNNRIGSTGISPNVTIIPVSLGRSMSSASVVQGMLYALYKGAQVINLSLGAEMNQDAVDRMTLDEQIAYSRQEGRRTEQMWKYVYDLMDERNCMAVFASGNSHSYTMMDNMKRADNTIIVDAVDKQLNKASFSNFAKIPSRGLDNGVVSAPGCDIVSTIPNRRLAPMSGTSMAAPIVTGAVALMKSVEPSVSNADIIKIIKETARPLGDSTVAPLLQIKPALDVLRKRRAEWDEFVKNPVGMWKSTAQFPIYNVDDHSFVANCHQYIIFETPTEGILELHAQGEDRVYNTRFKVQRNGECVKLTFQPQMSVDDRKFIYETMDFRPDKDRKVVFKYGGSKDDHFVKRMAEDDRVNKNKRVI